MKVLRFLFAHHFEEIELVRQSVIQVGMIPKQSLGAYGYHAVAQTASNETLYQIAVVGAFRNSIQDPTGKSTSVPGPTEDAFSVMFPYDEQLDHVSIVKFTPISQVELARFAVQKDA